jgi:two-component system nitrate/nitrite response regulator NarL
MDRRQSKEDQTVRLGLIEDHSVVRQALAFVLEREAGFEVVAQAGSVAEAREFPTEVDVAIIDLGLPDGNGTDVIRELRKKNPKTIALVLSATLDRKQLARAVEAGAAGLLHKSTPLEEIAQAVRRLLAGEALIAMEEVIEFLRLASSEREKEYRERLSVQQLTLREEEILRALAEGLNDKQIAQRLHISFETERNHMTNIFAKLGVGSRLQAILVAVRRGIVDIH